VVYVSGCTNDYDSDNTGKKERRQKGPANFQFYEVLNHPSKYGIALIGRQIYMNSFLYCFIQTGVELAGTLHFLGEALYVLFVDPLITRNATTTQTESMWVLLAIIFLVKLVYQHLITKVPQSAQVLLGIVVISYLRSYLPNSGLSYGKVEDCHIDESNQGHNRAKAVENLGSNIPLNKAWTSLGPLPQKPQDPEEASTDLRPSDLTKGATDATRDVSPETLAWGSVIHDRDSGDGKTLSSNLASSLIQEITSRPKSKPSSSESPLDDNPTKGASNLASSLIQEIASRPRSKPSSSESPSDDNPTKGASKVEPPQVPLKAMQRVGISDKIDRSLFVATSTEKLTSGPSSALPGAFPSGSSETSTSTSGKSTEQDMQSRLLRPTPDRNSSGKSDPNAEKLEIGTQKQSVQVQKWK
jgi:hypothetical protein